MLAALNMREARSKQSKQKYDDVYNYKTGDLVMNRNFDKKPNWDAKYMPNFRVVCLIGSRQLEVSSATSRSRKGHVCDAHRKVSSDHIVSSIPNEQVLGRRRKYINDSRILKRLWL